MGDVAATMNDEGILQLQEEHIDIDIANEDDNHNTTTAVSRQGLDNDNNDGRGGVVDDWNHYIEGDDGTDDGLSQQQQQQQHQQASPQQQQEEGGGEEHSRPRQQQQPPPHHHHTNTHHQRQRNNNNNNNNNQDWLQRRRNAAARFSCIYAWLSLTGAILAICTSARVGTTTTTTTTTPTTTMTTTTTTNGGDAIVAVVTTSTTKSSTEMEMELQQLPSLQQTWNLASVPPLSSSNGPTIVATNEPLPLDGKTDSNWNRRNSPTVSVASSSSSPTTTTASSLSSVEVSSSPPQQLQQESPLPTLPKQQEQQQEQSSGTSATASTPPKRKRASMLSAAFLSRPMRRKAWTQPVAAPTTTSTDTSASRAFEKKDIQESIPAKPAMDSQEQQQQQPLQPLPVWLRKIVMMRPGFLTTSQDSSSSPQQHKQQQQQQSPKNKEHESSPHDCPNMADLSSSSSSKWWQFFTVSSSQQQVADQPHVNRKPQAQAQPQPQEHKQQAENNIENATIISSDKATTTTTTDTPPSPPQKSKEPLPCTRWGCLLDTFRNVFVMGSIIRNEDAAPDDNNHRQEQEEKQQQQREQQEQITTHWIMDQTLLNPSSHTLTDLVDKILTSTPRLLAIANFLLALTYILHTAVADWFLGGSRQARQQRQQQQRQQRDGNDNNSNHSHHDGEAMDDNDDDEDLNNGIPGLDNPANAATYSHHHYAILEHGREKMGGFLVFKLLLVSAVITPDTVDLLILLSWYTLLAFLRSLAHLCANAVQYASAAGQVPAPGVWQLLLLVWMSNCLAAVTCVALFSGAGVSMVLLLTCDCALTAVDVLAYLLQHVQATWEIQHATAIAQLEEEEQEAAATAAATRHVPRTTANQNDHHDNNDDIGIIDYDEQREIPTEETQEQRSAEETARQIQSLEERHNSRVSLIESTVFALQLLGNVITVCHFLHIWSWHGVQFTLIDGVLALHLHSAISSASKKIAQRRNLHRIARDLDDVFPDATDDELAAAAAAGDVCCVCLSSLTSKKVKKVPCGHLYHTACLREVVERARSMEAARCPLCRASLLDGQYHNTNNNNNNTINDNGIMNNNNNNAVNRDLDIPEDGDNAAAGAAANNPEADQRPLQDQALFRISTEGIVPSWIPIHIPSFSFEVVRRAPPPPHPADPQQGTTTTTATIQPQEQDTNVPGAEPNNTNNRNDQDMANDAPPRQQEAPGGGTGTSSLLRRLLVIAGAMSMSPEEEAMALDQLVDMFPQYDRADLLRELRDLGGSAEVVAERILSGSFSGVPR